MERLLQWLLTRHPIRCAGYFINRRDIAFAWQSSVLHAITTFHFLHARAEVIELTHKVICWAAWFCLTVESLTGVSRRSSDEFSVPQGVF
ncbi:MAG: hypothetical protein H6935_12260 [Thiobacillus sp.]|nr:hypothetical protein [Thiobacillus sp.]